RALRLGRGQHLLLEVHAGRDVDHVAHADAPAEVVDVVDGVGIGESREPVTWSGALSVERGVPGRNRGGGGRLPDRARRLPRAGSSLSVRGENNITGPRAPARSDRGAHLLGRIRDTLGTLARPSLRGTMSYLDTAKDFYRSAALTPEKGLCCTTSPVWSLPEL